MKWSWEQDPRCRPTFKGTLVCRGPTGRNTRSKKVLLLQLSEILLVFFCGSSHPLLCGALIEGYNFLVPFYTEELAPLVEEDLLKLRVGRR